MTNDTTAPERIWANLNVSPVGVVLQGTLTIEPSEIVAQVEYVRADLPAAVTVKPLEWDDNLAQTIIGAYTYGVIGRCWRVYFNGWIVASGEETTFCDALKAAKAHAQEYHAEQVAKLVNVTPAPGEQPVTEGSVTKNCTLDPMPREDVKLPPMIGTTEQPSVQEDNETLIDEIEEIISETHDIDVTDRNYAENIVGWLRLHHPAALRALKGGE